MNIFLFQKPTLVKQDILIVYDIQTQQDIYYTSNTI